MHIHHHCTVPKAVAGSGHSSAVVGDSSVVAALHVRTADLEEHDVEVGLDDYAGGFDYTGGFDYYSSERYRNYLLQGGQGDLLLQGSFQVGDLLLQGGSQDDLLLQGSYQDESFDLLYAAAVGKKWTNVG